MLPLVKHETTIDYVASTQQTWLQTRRTQIQTFRQLESTFYLKHQKLSSTNMVYIKTSHTALTHQEFQYHSKY